MSGQNFIGVIAHFTVSRGLEALDFYASAFGARTLYKLVDPADGRLGHAEIVIGTTRMMLNDEYPDFGAHSPDMFGGSPVQFAISVTDADAAMAQAVAAGAIVLRPVALQSHGSRLGVVTDPFGHHWSLVQEVEAVSADEMQRRWNSETAI